MVFFIRLFVPESKKWEHEQARGATSHWSNGDLVGVSDRLPRVDRDHLELVAGGHGPGRGRHHHGRRRRGGAVGIPLSGPALSRRAPSPPDRSRRSSNASSSGTCCSARASPASRCSARGDRFNGRRAGRSSSSPTRAGSRGNTHRSRRRSARSSSRFSRASSRENSGAASRTPALCVGSILSCLLLYQGNDRFDGFFLVLDVSGRRHHRRILRVVPALSA